MGVWLAGWLHWLPGCLPGWLAGWLQHCCPEPSVCRSAAAATPAHQRPPRPHPPPTLTRPLACRWTGGTGGTGGATTTCTPRGTAPMAASPCTPLKPCSSRLPGTWGSPLWTSTQPGCWPRWVQLLVDGQAGWVGRLRGLLVGGWVGAWRHLGAVGGWVGWWVLAAGWVGWVGGWVGWELPFAAARSPHLLAGAQAPPAHTSPRSQQPNSTHACHATPHLATLPCSHRPRGGTPLRAPLMRPCIATPSAQRPKSHITWSSATRSCTSTALALAPTRRSRQHQHLLARQAVSSQLAPECPSRALSNQFHSLGSDAAGSRLQPCPPLLLAAKKPPLLPAAMF